MKWVKELKGRCFHFGEGKHSAIFLEDCKTLDEDSIWLTDILVNGLTCKAVINWDRLINNIPNESEYEGQVNLHEMKKIQMYIPHYEWERGFDDVTLI